jgi:hypothetical protein
VKDKEEMRNIYRNKEMYPCNYNWKELKLLDIRTDIQNIKLMVKTEKKKRNKET